MSNPGISAQYGFGFQKLVFLYYVLVSFNRNEANILYEADDDVQLNTNLNDLDDSIGKYKSGNALVQCKTGNIKKDDFRKVVKNWLLFANESITDFILFSEKDIPYNFDNEKSEIKEEITNFVENAHNKTSILYKLHKKYFENGKFDESLFNDDYEIISRNAKIKVSSYNELLNTLLNLYKTNYIFESDNVIELVANERFDQIKKEIFYLIDEKLLGSKKSIFYTFKEFNNLNHKISSNITENHYSVNYSIFKNDKMVEIDDICTEHTRELTLLKKIFGDNKGPIYTYLIEEIFYSRYRDFLVNAGLRNDIDDIEAIGFDNYETQLAFCDDLPELFKMTINCDFVTKRSDFITVCKRGCYIYLSSDDAINSRYFIDWNGENAR